MNDYFFVVTWLPWSSFGTINYTFIYLHVHANTQLWLLLQGIISQANSISSQFELVHLKLHFNCMVHTGMLIPGLDTPLEIKKTRAYTPKLQKQETLHAPVVKPNTNLTVSYVLIWTHKLIMLLY